MLGISGLGQRQMDSYIWERVTCYVRNSPRGQNQNGTREHQFWKGYGRLSRLQWRFTPSALKDDRIKKSLMTQTRPIAVTCERCHKAAQSSTTHSEERVGKRITPHVYVLHTRICTAPGTGRDRRRAADLDRGCCVSSCTPLSPRLSAAHTHRGSLLQGKTYLWSLPTRGCTWGAPGPCRSFSF